MTVGKRQIEDVLAELRPVRDVDQDKKRPRPTQKRVRASVDKEPAMVIDDAFWSI